MQCHRMPWLAAVGAVQRVHPSNRHCSLRGEMAPVYVLTLLLGALMLLVAVVVALVV